MPSINSDVQNTGLPCTLNLLLLLLHSFLAFTIGCSDFFPLLLANYEKMVSMLVYLLMATFVFFFFYLFVLYFRLANLRRKKSPPLPPGPVPWPIIGSLPEMLNNKPSFRWIHRLMKEMNTNIACIRLGSVHVIPVDCPAIAREFLKKYDADFVTRPINVGTNYLSRGFLSIAFTPANDQWKKMRRVMMSEIMNPAKLRWLHNKRVEEADNLVHYVYNQCKGSEDGGPVNVRVAAQQYCANVMRKMVISRRHFGVGKADGGPGIEEGEHMDALFTILGLVYAFSISDYLPNWLRLLDLDGEGKKMKKAVEVVDKYHDPIIEERIKEWRSGERNEIEDILDILISVKDNKGKPLLSTEEIKAEVTELFITAVDNPSNAFEWALAEMINQPKILQKALEEIDRVVGKGRWVQESDVSQLNYIKACAREALRLHPITAFNLPHIASRNTTVAGYFIPKGSQVLLSRVGLGRNPKVWDEPLKFKPERHLGLGNVELLEPDLRLLSFSTGRRGCIGVPLGTILTVTLFARLLQGFTWSAPANVTHIDLSESKNDLFMAKPLVAQAKPRMPVHVYLLN